MLGNCTVLKGGSMRKLLIIVLLVVLTACAKTIDVPVDLSDHVTVTQENGALLFDTSQAEKELGRKFEFYTHQRKSSTLVSFMFYDKNANLIGYANVTIKTNEAIDT